MTKRQRAAFYSLHFSCLLLVIHASVTLCAQTRLKFPRVINSSSERTGIAIANLSAIPANLTFRAYDPQGQLITGTGITNPATRRLQGSQQLAEVAHELFGSGFITNSAWVEVESDNPQIAGFFLFFDDAVNFLDGAETAAQASSQLIFTEIEGAELHLTNPNASQVDVSLELISDSGEVTRKIVQIPPRNRLTGTVSTLFPSSANGLFSEQAINRSLLVSSTKGLLGFGLLGDRARFVAGLNGQWTTEGGSQLYVPQYVEGGGFASRLSIVNLDPDPANVTLRLVGDDGLQIGSEATRTIPGRGKLVINDPSSFGLSRGAVTLEGYIVIRSDGPRLAGSVVFGDTDRDSFEAALPFVSRPQRNVVYSQVAQNNLFFTGVAVTNLSNQSSTSTIDVFDAAGRLVRSGKKVLPARGRDSFVLTELFPDLNISRGYFRVRSDQDMATFAVFGSKTLGALAAVPPQYAPPAQLSAPTFRKLDVSGMPPAERSNHTAVYDSINHRMIVFGGRGSGGTTNDLWALNLQDLSWQRLDPSGLSPAPRFGHNAIFDRNRRRMIIYAGQQGSTFFNDTWAYDITTNQWQDISPSNQASRPKVRYGSIMEYDSREGRAISFAGFTDQGRFDDTQAFRLSNSAWQDISPAGPRPLRRCLHTAAYDSLGHSLLIFGGQSTGALGDTWVFDLKTNEWRELQPSSSPDRRFWAQSVFDQARNQMILFGGTDSQAFNDTWTLNLETEQWSQLSTEGLKPSARHSHSTIFIESERRILIFGGTGASHMNDTWELRLP